MGLAVLVLLDSFVRGASVEGETAVGVAVARRGFVDVTAGMKERRKAEVEVRRVVKTRRARSMMVDWCFLDEDRMMGAMIGMVAGGLKKEE